MSNENFPWNGVAATLAAIHARHEIPELCGESIVDCEQWGDRYSAVSLTRLGATAVTVPTLIGCTPRAACEAKGMEVLGVATVDDIGESIVLVRGTGDANRPAIEVMWREFDAEFARAPAEAARLGDQSRCGDSVAPAGTHGYWNRLARFFARMREDHGLGNCSDVLVDDASDDLVPVFQGGDESSDDIEGVYSQIGEGPSLHVMADPQSPPSVGNGKEDADLAFASIESLGCTVFSFSADAEALDNFELSARWVCQRHGLEMLGVCFVDDTLECLVIVSGTRRATETKVASLWQETESDPGRLRELADV